MATTTLNELNDSTILTAGGILRQVLDSKHAFDLFIARPDLFNLTALPLVSQAAIMDVIPDNIRPDFNKLRRPSDRLHIYAAVPTSRKYITFTDDEIKRIPNGAYSRYVVGGNCTSGLPELLRKDKVLGLCKQEQRTAFLNHTDWYISNIGAPPKLTSRDIGDLSETNRDFVIRNLDTLLDSAIPAYVWVQLLKSKFKLVAPKFVAYSSRIHPTDLRYILDSVPRVIREFKYEHIESSKLTAKEWIYVVDRLSSKLKTLDAEMVDFLESSVTMELLAGTKNSQQLRGAITRIRELVKIDEDTTCQSDA